MEYEYTNEQLKKICQMYQDKKEYRRIYYGNKYKNDPKYRAYVRDYNKVRYENRRCVKYIAKGINQDEAELNRAKNIEKWFMKTDRQELFKSKYTKEYNLIYINGSLSQEEEE